MKWTGGPVIQQASGSVGGNTFSRNRFGQYIRARAIPTNPNTSRQQQFRNLFQTLAVVWSSVLTQVQRNAWNLYGDSVAVKDSLGQDIYLTGFNHFIRSNTVILGASATRVDDGPTIFTLEESDPTIVATISEATQQISLAFDDTLPWADVDGAFMQIQMSRPANVGVQYIPPIYRISDYIPGDSGTPPTSPQTMLTPFAVAEDQKVLVRCRIGGADGRLSAPFLASADIAS